MKIIVFEGCDGVGKTSQAFLLADELQKKYRVYCSREPFGAPIFDSCRFGIKQLLCNADRRLAVQSEVMLFLMSRFEQARHLMAVQGEYDFAIIDRFSVSTTAYQCYGLGFPKNSLEHLEQVLDCQLTPDITFLLDADYAVIGARQSNASYYYESLGRSLYEKVRRGFLDAVEARGEHERYVTIDAAQPQAAVHDIVLASLKNHAILS